MNHTNPQPAQAAVSQTPQTPSRIDGVCDALRSVGTSAVQIADFFQTNPTETHSVAEGAKGIAERLSGVADALSAISESHEKVEKATAEMATTGEWVSDRFKDECNQNASVNNVGTGIRVFNSFQSVLANQ